MALSSKTLFHFTSSLDTLEKILESKFMWPRYCTEYYWGGFCFALPMMCMCDIPLSEITPHIQHYGNYGIGLSAKWAEKIKEFSTVIYVKSKSSLFNEVCRILRDYKRTGSITPEELFLLSHIKKYSGNTYCSPTGREEFFKGVRFYDEREWRYVPQKMKGNKIFVKTNKDSKKFIWDDESTKGEPRFEYKDIRYLIVKDDKDRLELIEYIDKMNEASREDKILLKSKILTAKQIQEDF